MGAVGAGKQFSGVGVIVLPFTDAARAGQRRCVAAVKSKAAGIQPPGLLSLKFALHDPTLTRGKLLPKLLLRASSLRCRKVQTISSTLADCRVLVSAALQGLQYAVSRYTFKAVPRQARLGIVLAEFHRILPIWAVIMVFLVLVHILLGSKKNHLAQRRLRLKVQTLPRC